MVTVTVRFKGKAGKVGTVVDAKGFTRSDPAADALIDAMCSYNWDWKDIVPGGLKSRPITGIRETDDKRGLVWWCRRETRSYDIIGRRQWTEFTYQVDKAK